TVGLGASLLGVTGVLAAATAADARTRYAAPLVVLPTGPGLPAAALDRVARTPGVATEVSIVDTDVYAVAHRALRAQHALGLAGGALAYTLRSVVNTVAMAAGTRLAEYGRLRLAGAWRRQVLAMVAWEATGVTAAGVALGGTVAAVTVGGAWLSLRAPADAF